VKIKFLLTNVIDVLFKRISLENINVKRTVILIQRKKQNIWRETFSKNTT